MATHTMFIVLLFQLVSCSDQYYKNEGFMDHLNNGMKLAHNLLGSESVALKVADFVVRAFNTVNTQGGTNSAKQKPAQGNYFHIPSTTEQYLFEEPPEMNKHDASPWPYLVRLLGLQPTQLSAVAVNALVFVAQMITSFLTGPTRPSKPYRSDNPTEWIMNTKSKKLQDIITTAKNETLTDLVEELVTKYGTQEETSCIKLLVCKISPFISRMQDAVFGKDDVNNVNKEIRGAAVLYRHLPSNHEIRGRSDVCEKRFPNCELNE